jgi:hypothetical protein
MYQCTFCIHDDPEENPTICPNCGRKMLWYSINKNDTKRRLMLLTPLIPFITNNGEKQ